MSDSELEDALRRAAEWAKRGGSPETTAAPGEVWYVSNDALGIVHADTKEHPAIIIAVTGGVVRVNPGTGDPRRHSPCLLVYPKDLETVDGDCGLSEPTHFATTGKPLSGNSLRAIRRRIGKLSPQALGALAALRRSTLKGQSGGTNS